MSNSELLAQEMGVHRLDLECLMRSVGNSMSKDNVVGCFLESSEEDRIKMLEAYVVHAKNKMDEFTSIYFSRPSAQDALADAVIKSISENL